MRLSELIEAYIKELMEDNDDFIEFGRNELAEHFHCVPSQINYVISTRFSPERGYYVESRRGGGGNIRIKRIELSQNDYIMHILHSIESNLSQNEVGIMIQNMVEYDIISKEVARLMSVATNDKVLNLPNDLKDGVRTRIFKNLLINLI